MADCNVLKRMFNPDVLIALVDYHGKKKVILEEPQTTDSTVAVFNIPDDAVVVDLDRAFNNEKLFAGSQGECKRADFLLISEQQQKVIFIEMKRGKAKEGDIIKQLTGSLCAFEYCQRIADAFFNEADFLAGYQKRFVSLTHIGSIKTRTSIGRKQQVVPVHDKPERMMKISGRKALQFKQIAQ